MISGNVRSVSEISLPEQKRSLFSGWDGIMFPNLSDNLDEILQQLH